MKDAHSQVYSQLLLIQKIPNKQTTARIINKYILLCFNFMASYKDNDCYPLLNELSLVSLRFYRQKIKKNRQ